MSRRGGYIGFNRTPLGNLASGIWNVNTVAGYRRSNEWPGSLLVLDAVTGAAAAYSLRNLFFGANTSVVRVRRSSDNTEQDFTGAGVIDGTLAAFCGVGDGFVRTWYDQSGNARNVGQATTNLQPQIVSSGSVYTLNGKPAIDWTSSTANKVMTGTVPATSSISVSTVFSAQRRAGGYIKLFNWGPDSETSGYALTPFTGQAYQDWADYQFLLLTNGFLSTQGSRIISTANAIVSSITTQNKLFASMASSFARMDINNSEIAYSVRTAGASTSGTLTLYLGNNDAGIQQFIGRMQEVIIWASDKSANRQTVQIDINSYYGGN